MVLRSKIKLSDRKSGIKMEGSEWGSDVCKDLGKWIGMKGTASTKALSRNMLGMFRGQCGWNGE